MRVLGFDIGVASIGFAFVENGELKDVGVRIFTKAENPKTGESLALPRREARSARRRLSRRSGRLNTIKQLICKEFKLNLNDYISSDGALPQAYESGKKGSENVLKSPYELRDMALKQRLDSKDLARVILHIAKHRGYGNKHAKDATDSESGKVKKAIGENRAKLRDSKCESVGQYLFKEFYARGLSVRNKNGKYERCMSQDMLRDELELIFTRQREFGVSFSDEFKEQILNKVFEQRPLKDFSDKVGKCCFYGNEPDEFRAPKSSLSAIEFIALSRIINTLKNLTKTSGEVYGKEQILKILSFVLDKGELTYAALRKEIGLPESVRFRDSKLDYTKDIKSAEKAKFVEFRALKELKKALGEGFYKLDRATFDSIARDITLIKDRFKLIKKLEAYPLEAAQIEALSNLNFSDHINLGFKVLGEILPLMRGEGLESCMRYDEAVAKLGLQEIVKEGKKGLLLPPLSEFEPHLANPVVGRAMSEYRKVLNALLKKHGRVHKIHIEFARNVGVGSKERQEIEREQRANYAANERARKLCEDLGLEPSGGNVLKAKLWHEQGEACAYSGQKIRYDDLKDPMALQVDHIYPYSRSFDDSYMNKVLVFTRENQIKGNKTPFEAFGADTQKWGGIQSLCQKLPKKKARRILNDKFVDKEGGFRLRNIVDTSYIARLAAQYTDTFIEFLPLTENENTMLEAGQKGSKRHISVVSGTLTSTMRHYWGLGSKNRDNHLHHAVDAVIIAYINNATIKAFSDFKKQEEINRAKYYAKQLNEKDYKTQRVFFVPKCVATSGRGSFRNYVNEKLDSIFVSKPPRKRARGALHEETFYSCDDPVLLKNYGGKLGVQRALELGKIRQIGTKIVSNGAMIRVDIFKHKKSGKFYGVPIYTMDFALGILPNKAVVQGKDKNGVIKDWLTMSEEYEFIFSLYKDDLILVQKGDMEQAELCYYMNFVSSNAQINVEKHDNRFETLTENQKLLFSGATQKEVMGKSIGIQNLKVFEKYQVSVLGEVGKAPFYPREAIRKPKKSSKK